MPKSGWVYDVVLDDGVHGNDRLIVTLVAPNRAMAASHALGFVQHNIKSINQNSEIPIQLVSLRVEKVYGKNRHERNNDVPIQAH